MKKLISVLLAFVSTIAIITILTWQAKNAVIPSALSKTNALQVVYRLTGDTKDFKITPLKGGLSESTLYKVDSDNKSYVIRLIGHRSMEDKQREINAQAIASQEGWGPILYAADINEGWIIMDYIKPTILHQADRRNEALYIALGKRLQQIHTGPKFLSGKPILNEIEELLNRLNQQNKIPKSINYAVLKEILESIKKNHSTILAPIHRDLNPNNIIFSDNQPFIIDFENAAQDDPFYDLGTIGIFYIMHPYHETIFLNAYFDRDPTQQEYKHYQTMKQAALLFYGLNFLDFVPQEIVHNISVPTESIERMLQDVANGTIDIANNIDQLKLAVSILQEAINQYRGLKFHG